MPVPTVVTQSVTQLATNTITPTFNMPTVRPNRDLYILIVGKDDDPEYTSIPTHWTEIMHVGVGTAGPRMGAWWWTGSAEPATYTLASDSEAHCGIIYRIASQSVHLNSSPVNPIDSNSAFTQSLTNAPTGFAPSIAVHYTNELILRAISVDADIVTGGPTTSSYVGSSHKPSTNTGAVGFGASHHPGPASGSSTGVAEFIYATDSYAATTIGIIPFQEPDITAPILKSPRTYSVSSSAANVEIVTNEGNGTLYWTVGTASLMTPTNVKSAQKNPVDSGNQNVLTTGTQSLGRADGLTQNTQYWFSSMHEDASANQSLVVSSSFTTLKNVLVFNSWNTVLENTLLYWNGVLGTTVNTLNTSIFQGTGPSLPSTSMIQSIQRIEVIMGASTTGSTTITPVNRDNSIILNFNHVGSQRQSSTNSTADSNFYAVYFTSDSEVMIERNTADAANQFTCSFQIIECVDGVFAYHQTGSIFLDTNILEDTDSLNITGSTRYTTVINNGYINNVATSGYGAANGFFKFLGFSDVFFYLERGDQGPVGATTTGYYKGITWNSKYVSGSDKVEITMPSGNNTGSATLVSKNLDKTIIFNTGHTSATNDAGYDTGKHTPRMALTNPTTLEVYTNQAITSELMTTFASVVEFKPDYINTMQTGSTTLSSAGTSAVETISEIDLDKTVLFVDGMNSLDAATPIDPEMKHFTGEISSSTQLLFQTGATGDGNDLIINWRVVEFT